MMRHAEGVVEAILAEREGAQEISVRLTPSTAVSAHRPACRTAINLIDLTGPVEPGDRVLLNTIAVEMELGTGGLDFVISADRSPGDRPAPGHIMKLRYTPHQVPVLAVEAPESPHHTTINSFTSLQDRPVVCAELHSQIPAICAGARWGLRECGWPREPRITYIMTDGAALPMALSRLVPQMRHAGLIQTTITAGQAFGGDYEAVNLYSALAAASSVAEADIIVVGQGPGNVGTATEFGFSGIEQGAAINAVAALGGTPIIAPRISFVDSRPRHHGWSHHTLTVLKRVALAPALLPVPRLPKPQMQALRHFLDAAEPEPEHQPVVIAADSAYEHFLAMGLDVSTMGRTPEQARAFFLAACAAGVLAAQIVEALHDLDPTRE